MTDEKPSAEVETSETTTVGNKAGDADSGTNSTASGTDLSEERRKREATEEQLEQMAEQVLAQVPEHLRGLIPTSLSPVERVAWFNNAKATGVFESRSGQAPLDSSKAKTQPVEKKVWDLPPSERMAMGYRK